jgi:hypothetical protein
VTAIPPARPDQLVPGSEQDGDRVVRRFVTVLAVIVGGLCFLFSLGNVYQLAVDLELWVWIRPLVAPAVDLSLVALVVGIRFLARRGVSGPDLRRPRLFMLAVGLAAGALNTAGAVAHRDWGKAAFDSLAPGLLIGWAEVLPWFLRQFQAVTHPPVGADSRQPVHHSTAPPPTGDNGPIPAAASDRAVPAVPLPAAPVALAVPPGSGNGHRPRPASTAGGNERAADTTMRAWWAAERAPGGPPAARNSTGYAAGTPATALAARPAPATCAKRPPAASTTPNPFSPMTRSPPVPFPPRCRPGPGRQQPRPKCREEVIPEPARFPVPRSRSADPLPTPSAPVRASLPFSFPAGGTVMTRIIYVAVVVLAILILVGKQNTTALSAELVDLIGKAGEVLLALLRKALA